METFGLDCIGMQESPLRLPRMLGTCCPLFRFASPREEAVPFCPFIMISDPHPVILKQLANLDPLLYPSLSSSSALLIITGPSGSRDLSMGHDLRATLAKQTRPLKPEQVQILLKISLFVGVALTNQAIFNGYEPSVSGYCKYAR